MYYLASTVSDFFLPGQEMLYISPLGVFYFADTATLDPQNPVEEGKPTYRNGPSAKNTEGHGGQVDPAGFCRFIQGIFITRNCIIQS